MDKAIEKVLAENFDMDMLSSKYTMYYNVEIEEGDIIFETTTIYIKLNEHEKVLYRELQRVFTGIIMYDDKLREQRKPPQLKERNIVEENKIILKEILDNKIRTQADVDLIVKELCKKYWWDAGVVGYLTLGELSPKSKLVDEYINIMICKIDYTYEVSITEPSITGSCEPSDNAQLYVYTNPNNNKSTLQSSVG
jgi:hypothetical protein